MGPLPQGERGSCSGKLAAVLEHQLRIGDEETSEEIVAAYIARGIQPPEHLENPPGIEPEFLMYWEAYRDLISERVQHRGPIPALAIILYAKAYGIDPDRLKRIVWRTDRVLLEHWKGLDKAEEAKRKAEQHKPPAIGVSK